MTHLRLDAMFKEGSHWEDRVEKARWRDAERALEYVGSYYVEPIENFKEITEAGLKQLLLLADSKTAQEQFEGLQDELDRKDFKARVQQHLDAVREMPEIDLKECIQRFRRVVMRINRETVRLPEELVVSELVRGAMEPLDDFTTVIWPRDSEEFDKHTRGNFVGVGISIIKNQAEEVEVVTPLEDTPAYRAGIQQGDIIVKADGMDLKDLSLNKVVETITGPRGSMVTLTIRRDGKLIQFPLERAKVKIRSVKGIQRDPEHEEDWDHWLDRDLGIGYIRLTSFQKNTVEDVDNVMSELAAQGLRGLVIDVRTNPGGLLDTAWQVTSRFLEEGDTIVSTRGRIKHEDQAFNTTREGPYADIPIVVLVNEQSASASEILSGAIRDNGRGVVVGERTFGKFSVQNLIPLTRSGAKLKITTARYYLPSGASLQRYPGAEEWGVEPDVEVRLVGKEAVKVWQMQREANLLGPARKQTDDEDEDTGDDAEDPDSAKTGDEAAGDEETRKDGDAAAEDAVVLGDDEDEGEDNDLPPLEQPDENDRPRIDPQLDAALLLMRMTLVGESYPTLATADPDPERPRTAKP